MEGTNITNEASKGGFWSRVPGWIIVLITFLLPILFLPSNLIEASALKSVTFLGLLYIALFVWVILKFKHETFKLSFNLLSLSALLIPVVYLVSAFFSDNFVVSMFGRDFGLESVMVLSSFFALLLLGTSVLENKKTSLNVYMAILLSGGLIAIVHVLNTLFTGLWPDMGYFLTATSNTVGKWFDLGVFAGAAVILSLISIEFLRMGKVVKWVLNTIFALSLALVLLVGFNELWAVLGVFALVFFIYFLVIHRVSAEGKGVSLPVASLVTLIISIVFVIAGPKINLQIQNILDIDFVEARPALMTTAGIIKDAVVSDPVLGAGPGRFSSVWVANKPIESNLSDFWNVDFRYGFGFIPTLMATTGVLGILSWLFFLGTLLVVGFSSIFKPIKDSLSKFLLVSSFVVSLYLWIMLIIYIPSSTTLFLTFLFTAIFFASLHREKLIAVKEISVIKSPRHGFIYIFGLIVILLLVIGSTYKVSSRIYAAFLDRDVSIALGAGDWVVAEQKAANAINTDMTDTRFLQLSSVYQSQINQLLNNLEIDEETKTQVYQQLLSSAINANQEATRFDRGNYRNHLQLAELFLGLVNEDEPAAAEQVRILVEESRKLYPINPEVPLILARVEIASGDNEAARGQIAEALQLKPNYTNAIFLLSQLEVSEGNIEAAVANVNVVATIKPNDPVTFFQLGLLYYQNDEFTKAIPAFERAVILSPYYSNAKYFLGLGYYQEDRVEEAILQFEDLMILNPNNEEVSLIIDNLKSGYSPLSDLVEDPEDREDPPLDNDDLTDGEDTGITE